MFDLIIIGAGPAGITAGVYAARKGVNTLVLTKDIGGQAALSGDVENYTGYQFISGPELAFKFEEHIRKYAVSLKENEAALEAKKTDHTITVRTDKGVYESRTLIIASGKRSRGLNVAGENKFMNKGLTYCATCDGPLFAQKDVAVIGGGNSALDAVLQLVNIANHVYVVNTTANLGGDQVMRQKVEEHAKVTLLNNSRVIAVNGDKMVSSIRVISGSQEKDLIVQGVFVEVGLIPNSEFTNGIEKNQYGEIMVNCRNETNVPGIFAAGDVSDVPEKQIIIAAGEGSKACLSAFRYLSEHRF